MWSQRLARFGRRLNFDLEIPPVLLTPLSRFALAASVGGLII